MTAKEYQERYNGKRVSWSRSGKHYHNCAPIMTGVVASPSSRPRSNGNNVWVVMDKGFNWDGWRWEVDMNDLTLLDETTLTTTIDLTRYPHTCSRCKKPAYIGLNSMDCSANCGVRK